MFSNFWEWVLIIVILILVFGANNLHTWKTIVLSRLDNLKKTATEKKNELGQKIKDNQKKKD